MFGLYPPIRVRYKRGFLCLPLLFHAMAGSSATQSTSLTVSATLLATCSAGSTTNGATTFGTLDFGSRSLISQSVVVVGQANAGAVTVQCSSGVSYRVVLSGGNSGNTAQRYMLGKNAGQTLPYNLYSNAAYTSVWDSVSGVTRTATGQPEVLPVYARVPAQNAPVADTYQDTVQVTVSW
ncbi:hypothetical protein SOASR030_00610 [Leminorella grimontii]|uniref:Spore coat protein U/FanG domain-containing protein n=2 Tax=Leminorella grimontii TaxID=82981 RepID=A0AAV5MX09_9GAMM|nr:hypothetical protein SOASR030_00610 [Leminorella grimontii]